MAMDFLKNIGEKVSETGKAVGGKTKQVSEIAKITYKITAEEKAVEELYAVLGKACYEAENAKAESPYFGQCEEISAKMDGIEELKKQLNAIKGIVVCENCKAEISAENDFCGKCGAKLVKPVEEPVAVEDVVVDHEETVEADACGAEAVIDEEKSE